MDISQLQSQAESSDAAAQLKLARAYDRGDGVSKNAQTAAECYRRAADQGNAEAQERLGELYLTGEGVGRDKRESVKWFQKAARQGNANAMFSLGAAYYNGDGVDVDDSLSYAWFALAKEAGSQKGAEAVHRADSQVKEQTITGAFTRLAAMYENGGFMPADETKAAHWWMEAAKRGDHDAQLEMADKLIYGKGVAQDQNQARYWCNQAAKEREARGEYCVGYMLQNGMGGKQDAKEARKWYERAAGAGHVKAIRALAAMEAAGEGACVQYARLGSRGDKESLRNLVKLKEEIGAKKWKEVEKQLTLMRIDSGKLETAMQHADSP